MRIRPACIEEVDVLHGILTEAVRRLHEQGIAQWDEIYPDKQALARDIENREMHVIEQDGRVAGFIVINEDQPPEFAAVQWTYPGRALVVHRLTIAPACQNRGMATLLMDFAEETAAVRGYNCIRLDAFTRNPSALALYENRGYRKAGTVCFRKGEFCCYEKAIKEGRAAESSN
jgi:ribosomal protein S18 acetylase RimI-like enzyme